MLRRSIFCAKCPMNERCAEAPEIVRSEPVQQVAGYIEEFINYRDDYVNECVAEAEELERKKKLGEEVYVEADEQIIEANDAFIESAIEVQTRSLDYLDMLPPDISTSTTLALGACVNLLAAGECDHTGMMPKYAEKLHEYRELRADLERGSE